MYVGCFSLFGECMGEVELLAITGCVQHFQAFKVHLYYLVNLTTTLEGQHYYTFIVDTWLRLRVSCLINLLGMTLPRNACTNSQGTVLDVFSSDSAQCPNLYLQMQKRCWPRVAAHHFDPVKQKSIVGVCVLCWGCTGLRQENGKSRSEGSTDTA